MGAYVSLAFGLDDSQENLKQLDSALINAGLEQVKTGIMAQGMRQSEWNLHFAEREIPVICRNYQEDDWLSTTLDIEEKLFESFSKEKCEKLVRKLTEVAIRLMQKMNLRYIFFEEEAEADIAPNDYNADNLYAITLLSDKIPSLQEVCNQTEVKHTEQFDGGVVLYSRFPIPHYQNNW